ARLLAEERIVIEPYDESLVQPSSVDVRVDRLFRVFHNARYPFIDVKQQQEDLTELVEIDGDRAFILHPGEFVLGSTLERIQLPDDLVARLEGKSSLGRLGLLIHSTAGFIDPGWDGHVTLELSNVPNLPITIYQGTKIGQSPFVPLSESSEPPDGSGVLASKYPGQTGTTRCVLMSARGTGADTKDLVPYYHAKWEMEQTVKGSGLDHVIFRPSFVFGTEGGILPTFRRLAKVTPVTPIVGSGEQRLQPI